MFSKILLRSASTPIMKKSSWATEPSPKALVRSASYSNSWSPPPPPVSNSFSERRSPVSNSNSNSNSIKKISREIGADNMLLLLIRTTSSAPNSNGCSQVLFDDHPIHQETELGVDQEYCSVLVGGGGGSGVGNDGGGCGGGNGGSDDGEGADHGFKSRDEYYQKMIKANPRNALLLGNYARFLKEVRGEVEKAEEYFERAIILLANGSDEDEDGNVLSVYGDLIWHVHKNASRAHFYFDEALLAAPHDCYVLASYARFLWDAEEEEEEKQEEGEEEEEEEEGGEEEEEEEVNNGSSSSSPPQLSNFLRGLAFPPPPPPIAAS